MNRFNKLILMGLLSVVAGATNVSATAANVSATSATNVSATSVKGSTTPEVFFKNGYIELINSLEVTKIGDKDSKFFVIANPKLGSEVSDQACIYAIVLASMDKTKNKAKLVDCSDVTTFIDVSAELEISKALENVTSKDVVCVKTRTQYAQLNVQEKAKIAALYACWMIKAYGINCFEAIKAAKANLNLTGKGLTEDQTNLIELYFIEQNKDLLKSIEKAHPGWASSFVNKYGTTLVIAAAAAVALVCIGKMHHDGTCAANKANHDGLPSLDCMAAERANAVYNIAAEGANAVYNKVYGWLAFGIPAIYGSTAAGYTKVAEYAKKWWHRSPANVITATAAQPAQLPKVDQPLMPPRGTTSTPAIDTFKVPAPAGTDICSNSSALYKTITAKNVEIQDMDRKINLLRENNASSEVIANAVKELKHQEQAFKRTVEEYKTVANQCNTSKK